MAVKLDPHNEAGHNYSLESKIWPQASELALLLSEFNEEEPEIRV